MDIYTTDQDPIQYMRKIVARTAEAKAQAHLSPFADQSAFTTHQNKLKGPPIPLSHIQELDDEAVSSLEAEGVSSVQDLAGMEENARASFSQKRTVARDKVDFWWAAATLLVRNLTREVALRERASREIPDGPDISCNWAIVDPFLLNSLDRLFTGRDKVTIRSLCNLCTLTQAVVLHEKLVAPVTPTAFKVFEGSIRTLLELGLLEGPSDVREMSKEWGQPLLTEHLISQEILIPVVQDEMGGGPLYGLASEAFLSFMQNRLTLRQDVSDPKAIAQSWIYALQPEALGAGTQAFDELRWREIAAIVSHPVRLFASEAQCRGWHTCFDLTFFPQNWAPFSPSVRALDIIRRLDRQFIQKVREYYQGSHLQVVPIPMLTSLLLSRAGRRENIPDELLRLRTEFTDLRGALTRYDAGVRDCKSLADFEGLNADLATAWKKITERIKRPERRLVRRLFDTVKSGSIGGILTSLLDQLLEYDEERLKVGKLDGFINIWRQSADIDNYESLVSKCFGESLGGSGWRILSDMIHLLRAAGQAEPLHGPFD